MLHFADSQRTGKVDWMSSDPVLLSAYVGPGAGLGAVGALLALVGMAILMVVGFVWYPAKRLMRSLGRRGTDQTEVDSALLDENHTTNTGER